GSEGTLVTILEATLRLIDWPRAKSLLVVGYRDIYQAADHVTEIMRHQPMALEALDHRLIDNIRKKGQRSQFLGRLPEGHAYLIAEFGAATQAEADARAEAVASEIEAHDLVAHTEVVGPPAEQEQVWKIREA